MVGGFNRDEVLAHTWSVAPHGSNCCCACHKHAKPSWFVANPSGYTGKKLTSCPNDHTSWCALCEACGKQLGVVW